VHQLGFIPTRSKRAASHVSGRHRQCLDTLDVALLRTDALDHPSPETLPPAPSLFLPARLKFPFPYYRSTDAFQPQPLTSRPPPRYGGPQASLPGYHLPFNFVTSLSLNPFLTRNPSNIASVSPPPSNTLSLVAFLVDVFQSSVFSPYFLPTPSAFAPQPSDPTLYSPIYSGRPPPPCPFGRVFPQLFLSYLVRPVSLALCPRSLAVRLRTLAVRLQTLAVGSWARTIFPDF